MYEARQNKEKVSRRIDGGSLRKLLVTSVKYMNGCIQCDKLQTLKNTYINRIEHLCGEIENTTTGRVKGGHLPFEMKNKFSNNINIIIRNNPPITNFSNAKNGFWTVGKNSNNWKYSTFFPETWTKQTLKDGINNGTANDNTTKITHITSDKLPIETIGKKHNNDPFTYFPEGGDCSIASPEESERIQSWNSLHPLDQITSEVHSGHKTKRKKK